MTASKNRGKTGAGGLVLVILVAGILIAVNVISQRFFFRIDLTHDQRYSIADATKEILGELDDVVNVNAYFSDDLPPYLVTLRGEVEDILDEYRAYSGGRLRVEFEDPGDDPMMQQKLRALGIPQLQLEVLEKDQFKVSTAYLGMALHFGGRKEVIPVVQDLSRLEYELTGALVRLTTVEKKAVAWMKSPSGQSPPGQGGSPLQGELSRFYDVREISAEDLASAGDVKTLVVEAPRDLDDEAVGSEPGH